MGKIVINGVEFNDFGANNYSNGMRLVSCYPAPKDIVADVLAGKYPGLFLNPSAPCGSEFFGVYGTDEQYKDFKTRQYEAQIAGEVMRHFGGWDEYMHADYADTVVAEQQIRNSYKFWWER